MTVCCSCFKSVEKHFSISYKGVTRRSIVNAAVKKLIFSYGAPHACHILWLSLSALIKFSLQLWYKVCQWFERRRERVTLLLAVKEALSVNYICKVECIDLQTWSKKLLKMQKMISHPLTCQKRWISWQDHVLHSWWPH